MPKKKSAVPEYIWYISLIIISITLVVGIINITKKSNKNINPPSNLNTKLDLKITPQNQLILNELNFIGSFDLEKDLPNLYLCCNNKCVNILQILPKNYFARKSTGTIGLIGPTLLGYDVLIKYFPFSCSQKGAVWQLYYGDPNEGGVLLASDKVDYGFGINIIQKIGTADLYGAIADIEITNPNSYNLKDFQVKVNLGSIKDKINNNFVILDSNGNKVNYCFEQSNGECNTNATDVIWVKVPYIPANGETTLEIVSSSDNGAVNGDEVFDFYDDFNGNSLDSDKWQTNANSVIEVKNGYIRMWGGWNEGHLYLLSKTKVVDLPKIIEARGRLGEVNKDTDLQISLDSNGDCSSWSCADIVFNYDGQGTAYNFYKKDIRIGSGTGSENNWPGEKIESTDWQLLKIIVKNNYLGFWDSWTNNWLEVNKEINPGPYYLGLAGDTDNSGSYAYIDWVRVRKYADQEPKVEIK